MFRKRDRCRGALAELVSIGTIPQTISSGVSRQYRDRLVRLLFEINEDRRQRLQSEKIYLVWLPSQ